MLCDFTFWLYVVIIIASVYNFAFFLWKLPEDTTLRRFYLYVAILCGGAFTRTLGDLVRLWQFYHDRVGFITSSDSVWWDWRLFVLVVAMIFIAWDMRARPIGM